MNDDQLVKLVYYNIDNADTENESLRANIQDSDDYYFGRLPGAAPTGRSSAVALECQTACTAVHAELIHGFTSDQPCAFEPVATGDDEQAELESYAVSQALEDADGYQVLSAAIDSALRYKNAVCKVGVQEVRDSETQTVTGATAEQVAALIAGLPDNTEAEVLKATDDETQIRVTQTRQELVIEPVDVSLLLYQKDWPHPTLKDIPFVGIRQTSRRAELLELFPDKKEIIADLPATEGGDEWDTATRSKLVGEERSYTTADSRENDRVRWHEVWQEIPTGNGLTERRHIAVAERELLMDEPWSGDVPLATGSAFPQPFRFQGISLVDKLVDIQNRTSYAQRQLEDNLSAGNLSRTYGYKVNLGDVTSGRANGHIRMEGPDSVFGALPPNDHSSNSLAYLEFMKTQRTERAGSALELQNPSTEMLKNQAGAVANQQALTHQESMSQFIARNLGETFVRSLYLVIHERLRLQYKGELMLRRADEYVPVSPSEWAKRTRVNLKAGMSASARNRRAANLFALIQAELQFLAGGLPIVDINSLHTALKDWGLASDLDSINQYLIDPNSQSGQQLMQGQQQQQQAQQQMAQMQVQLEQADRELEKLKIDNERWKAEQEIKWKYYDTNIDAELETAKVITDAQNQQEKQDNSGLGATSGNGTDSQG